MADNHEKIIRIALAGNPNCGKTTIFNNITGAKQHVGNYAGVTVEKKEGTRNFEGYRLDFIDLPGTYSLTARSLDELVARNVIVNDNPDLIMNVLDESNLERNLYLAAQLIELEKPMVIALNMDDVAKEMGVDLDLDKMAELTGATIVPTVGRNNEGTDDLLRATIKVAQAGQPTKARIDYGSNIEPAIAELQAELEEIANLHYPLRWVAVKLLENDADVVKKVKALSGTEGILAKAQGMRKTLGVIDDMDVIFQEKRHEFAVQVFNAVLRKPIDAGLTRSDKIDKIITNRWLGLPIFALVMYLLFNFVNLVGSYPQDWLADCVTLLGDWGSTVMPEGQLQSLIVNGVIAGVGAVLSFIPLIILLFMGISFLEDTGYMARAAFVIDRIMRSCGLHGKSFIPLILGFGCSIPGIMGARILDNRKDRMVTILVMQLMSCSARLPIYTLFAAAFFTPAQGGTVLFSVYFAGIILAVIMAIVFRKTLFKGEAEPFVMEMPPYHMPTLKSVLMHMWERAVLYLKKAGTFILAASILVWFLVSYPQNVQYSQDYDGASEQINQIYEEKDAAIMNHFGFTAKEQQDKIMNLVDQMNTIAADQEEDDQSEDTDEDAAEASQDADEATKIADEGNVAATDIVATAKKVTPQESIARAQKEEVPDYLTDLKEGNKANFDAAWAVYVNDQDKDTFLKKLDGDKNAEKIGQSYAARFGQFVEPIMRPLGFDWKMSLSLVAAMAAKEVMVSTLGTIYAVEADEDHESSLAQYLHSDPDFTPLIAVCLMVFVLIYPPCIAAMAVFKREAGSWGWLAFFIVYATVLAWVVAWIVRQVGLLLGFQ